MFENLYLIKKTIEIGFVFTHVSFSAFANNFDMENKLKNGARQTACILGDGISDFKQHQLVESE